MRAASALLVLAAAAAAPAAAQETPITAHLRDGSQIPLQSWTLSYEYATWAKGTPPALARTQRHEVRLLIEDKAEIPVAGTSLVFEFEPRSSQRFVDGEMKRVQIEQPVRFTLLEAGGKERRFKKPKAPHQDRLVGEAEKDKLFQARGLDLRGETLTGTRRSFCLFTYTSLVECSDDPSQQVVRIDFP